MTSIRPVKHGRYWFAERTTDGRFFGFPSSRHSITPRWHHAHTADGAAGFSVRWALEWAVKQYGITVLPPLPSTRTGATQ